MRKSKNGGSSGADDSDPSPDGSTIPERRNNEDDIRQQEELFRTRSRRLKQNASIALLIVLFPLMGGAMFVIVAATSLVGQDLARVQLARIDRFAEESSVINRDIELAQQEIARLEALDPENNELQMSRNRIMSEINFYKERLIILRTRASEVNDTIKEINRSANQEAITSLVHVNITRFGMAGIIVFAIVLMIGIYRYNMRLSVFHESRADALKLLLLNENPKLLQRYFDSVTPSADFGKAPKLPIEYLTDIASKIYSR